MKFVSVISLFFAAQLSAVALDLAKSKNTVEFLAVGQPSALRIRGKANPELVKESPLKGSLTITGNSLSGTAAFLLKALDTGIELRDTHMKDKYLEVEKYPNAELTITKLNFPESLKGENLPFEGQLLLHGVKKPVTGRATVEKSGTSLTTKFEFKTLISEYGIQIPSYMGIKIANEVTITALAEGNIQ